MEQARPNTVFQVKDRSGRAHVVMCNVCDRKVAEVWASEREANLLVARHAMAHLAAIDHAN